MEAKVFLKKESIINTNLVKPGTLIGTIQIESEIGFNKFQQQLKKENVVFEVSGKEPEINKEENKKRGRPKG